MVTTLGIVLAVLIVLNVWLVVYTTKKERERRKQLQERLDEYDKSIGEVMAELGRAKVHLDEMQGAYSAMKKTYEELLGEHEDLKIAYQKKEKELEEKTNHYNFLAEEFKLLQKICQKLKEENDELKRQIAAMTGDPGAEHKPPVESEGPKEATTTAGEKAEKVKRSNKRKSK